MCRPTVTYLRMRTLCIVRLPPRANVSDQYSRKVAVTDRTRRDAGGYSRRRTSARWRRRCTVSRWWWTPAGWRSESWRPSVPADVPADAGARAEPDCARSLATRCEPASRASSSRPSPSAGARLTARATAARRAPALRVRTVDPALRPCHRRRAVADRRRRPRKRNSADAGRSRRGPPSTTIVDVQQLHPARLADHRHSAWLRLFAQTQPLQQATANNHAMFHFLSVLQATWTVTLTEEKKLFRLDNEVDGLGVQPFFVVFWVSEC